MNFVKKDEQKEGIDVNAFLVNLTEEKMSPQHPTYPPKLCSHTSTSKNYWDCFNKQVSLDEDVDVEISQTPDDLFSLPQGCESRSQSIKEQVTESFQNSYTTSESRLIGFFCSETIFNLNHRVLAEVEIKALEKRLDFAPMQCKINESELKQEFNDLCRKMHLDGIFGTKNENLVKLNICIYMHCGMSCHKAIVVITGRAHCFHDNIHITLILLL